MDSYFIIKSILDRIYGIFRILFNVAFCQFPEETDKNQSPPARGKIICNNNFEIKFGLEKLKLIPFDKSITPIPLKADSSFTVSSGNCEKNIYPIYPVNPV